MTLRIRPYTPADREALVEVCVRTARAGEHARGHLDTPELYAEIWALPYVELEPDLAFVLDDGAAVLGYVLGVADSAAFRERAEREWFPAARARHPRRPDEDPRDGWLLDILHAPLAPEPACVDGFPAHLHVDVLPEAQGGGWGRRLIATLCDELARRGVPGLHLGVAKQNTRALSFYAHLGLERAGEGPGVVYLTLPLTR